jgi:hypothetical protein
MADKLPSISPAAAARAHAASQAAAQQGPRPSTPDTRNELARARTAGNSAAATR